MKKNRTAETSLIDFAAGDLGLDDDDLKTVTGGMNRLRLGAAETFCDYTCSQDSCCQSGGEPHLR